MTTKLTDKNISNVANLGIQWQAVITSDGSTATTAVAGRGYLIDTTSNTHTINLPSSAIAGDTIAIKDYAGTFGSNALTIGRNGNNIQGTANDSQLSTNRASVELIYVDSTRGWVYTNESNVADLQFASFISATGGTITTSGDFKIHVFTGDGCFVVSTAGNSAGSDTVDYLVVAGGGATDGNRSGGGGAGGYRESSGNSGPYTASPLATPTGITVTATTYPVTVGGGGSGAPACGGSTSGSNSIFSTITSAGGARNNGVSGGSGSGGIVGFAGGAGNTPPTNPPQGNSGGAGGPNGGGGGGGAGAVGAVGNSTPTGAGGNGVTTSISGSPTAYAGGGGGGEDLGKSVPGGLGGGGASGDGGTPGTINTGGGAGGGNYPSTGGNGGSGIIIIRYKFQ